MMLNDATMQYALAHADDDVRQLALCRCPDPQVDVKAALQQIEGRQAARRKLPSWAAIDGIVYPPRLSMEQCSSEATARYKAGIVSRLPVSGSVFTDLTGGFGVDFAFMASLFHSAVYVEQREQLCTVARLNFSILGLQQVSVVCADGVDYVQHMQGHLGLVFIDPARRDDHGGRTYGIGDCQPDVLPLLPLLLSKADYVLLKLSPMLDWRKAMADVGSDHVEQVHIVSVGGECKELLLLLSAAGRQQPELVCSNDERIESFQLNEGEEGAGGLPVCDRPQPSHYLFEPNASLMKAGRFRSLAERYGVQALAPSSHLFVSARGMVASFPGRAFVIDVVSTMNKHDLRQHIAPLRQANISVRNFPLSVAQLRKRLKLSEGGGKYIFATTLASGEHVLLVCSKV